MLAASGSAGAAEIGLAKPIDASTAKAMIVFFINVSSFIAAGYAKSRATMSIGRDLPDIQGRKRR